MKQVYQLSKNEKEELQKNISHFLKKKDNILFAYLHGSFLVGPFHDIDIAIFLKPLKLNKASLLRYELMLETKLQEQFHFPFDVRILSSSPLAFRFSVIKNGILLFSKDESKRTDFESLSFVKYHDFHFYLKRYLGDSFGIHV
ncbi:MAG: nucleotidyltransferase domain-containing protein [Candidatus Thermoplasmatota archaeon]|nr:nucleotidyltransferase domain-containing protein [Candidatus Thermoplasmatota archaeon]MBS3802743.1 nucleotidyltransferase domain-containing protein [Candidatus Thermoplasmatota archaeon]